MRMGDPVVVSSGSSSSSSRSRSSSPKRRERYDRFGRIIQRRGPSRSKSRSRRIPGRRRQSHNRSRSRSYHSFRSRGSRRSRSRSSEREKRGLSREHLSNKTNIDDPRFLNARVFIGALPVDKVTKEDLEQKFAQYGKVLGVSIHDRGFGFIQFDKEEEARKAVENEKGSLYKGNVLDVKMAAEGRRNRDQTRAGGRSKSPFNRDRGYPASSASGGPPARDGLASQPPARERSPLRGADPYDDRYRDPYRDRVPPPPRAAVEQGRDLPSAHLPPPDLRRDDPYYADPYRRPLPVDDLYYDRYRDDPYRYRREPYGDPYRERDPYFRDYYDLPPPPPRKPSPPDCMIIIMNAKLRKYAEILDERLRVQMLVEIVVIPEDRTVPQMIEEASFKKCLFAIIVNSQNEAHRSITLNIIHGTPQEHRNMPLEDAMSLILRSHDQYLQAAREKTATQALPTPRPQAPAVPSTPFIPPGAETSYLLNLLADNRQLTIEELDKVIIYLKERKEKLMEVEGRRPPPMNNEGRMSYEGGDQQPSQAYLQQQQQELQAKILSILNGSGTSNSPAAGTGGGSMPNASQAGLSSMGHTSARGGTPISHAAQQGSGGSSMINLDHPNVQKALDNLIQSGPNLLRSIASNTSVQSPPTVASSMMMNRGGMTNTTGGMYSGQQQQQPIMHQQQQGYAGQTRQPPGLSMGLQGMQSRSMMAQQARTRPM